MIFTGISWLFLLKHHISLYLIGGIRNFSHNQNTYEKWVLNRPFQAKMVESLLCLAEIGKPSTNPRNCLRETQMKKSEEKVQKIIKVMKDVFLNPFSEDLEKDKLFNLSSGRPLPLEVAEQLLSAEERGVTKFEAFNDRLDAKEEQAAFLFDPIKRSHWKGFGDAGKKVMVKAKGKTKDVAVQRDILGLLVTVSYKEKELIDIDKALAYPLAPIPLSLATSDGCRRKTVKSKLFDAALTSVSSEEGLPGNISCYVMDLAASLRCIVKLPNTFEDLALKLLSELPNHCRNIYVACDTYADRSIKNSERQLRGDSEEFVIRSCNVRIPSDFKGFLANGKNKERLFELIEEVWVDNSFRLGDRVVYFARKDTCLKIGREEVAPVHELQTNHEEADTKISYLLHHALRQNNGQETVSVVRSSSGDIDIPIILLANEIDNLKVFIDNGTGKARKILDLTSCDLSRAQKQALLGMHAFSGNDYISSFFRKGKKAFWKIVKDRQEYIAAFSDLGTEIRPSESLVSRLEKFTCSLYGEKRLELIDDARRAIFWRNFAIDKKITDLSLLPPCRSSLERHIRRANFVARIWRQSSNPMIESEEPNMHGWNDDFAVDWISDPYPEDISEFFVTDDADARGDNWDNVDEEDDGDLTDYEDN